MLRGSLLVTVLLPLAIGASALSAASQVHNGRIAFEHVGESGAGQIYTMIARGTNRRLLTRNRKASSLSPAYSPNGRRIVFVRSFKQSDLWLMRADGSHQRRLTRTPGIDETEPGWSPDGKEIVFTVRSLDDSPQGISIVGVDGRHRRQLTGGKDTSPSWSPDGSEIAFSRFDDSTEGASIIVIPANGGTLTDLSSDPGAEDFDPDWSPDGNRILFAKSPDTFRSDVYVMNADGSDVRQVTTTPERDEQDPVWSPDGQWIAYVGEGGFHGASSYQLYVSRPDGSTRRIVTHACGECAIVNTEPSWQRLP